MKFLRLSALLMVVTVASFAQKWEFGSDLTFAQPNAGMKRDMNNAFGLTLDIARTTKNSPFTLGAEFGYSNYGTQNSMQEYTFDDGTTTETNVHVSNDIYNLHLTAKYFLRRNKNFNPYVSAKAGWSWFKTNLTIDDPDDVDGCTPLENDVLQKDNTYSVSGGVGARIDFKTFFRNVEREHFYFDLSVHAIQGGRLSYMNVKEDPSQPQPAQSDVVMGRFLNARTQVIHEHHVGYVYSNFLNMVEYRLGVIFRPGL